MYLSSFNEALESFVPRKKNARCDAKEMDDAFYSLSSVFQEACEVYHSFKKRMIICKISDDIMNKI